MSRIVDLGCIGRDDRLLFQAPILFEELIEIARLIVLESANPVATLIPTSFPSFQRLVTLSRRLTLHILLTNFNLAIPRGIGTFICTPNSTALATRLVTGALDLMCMASLATAMMR